RTPGVMNRGAPSRAAGTSGSARATLTGAVMVFIGLSFPLRGARAGEPPEPAEVAPAEAPPGREAEPADGSERPKLPLGGTIDALREKATRMPPLSGRERVERAAGAIRGWVHPLPTPVAISVTVVGLVLMLFGRRLFRSGIVLYFMSMLGLAGREIGRQSGEGVGEIVGALIGCVAGVAVALPLRAVLRALVGALTGAILAAIVAQSVTSDWKVTIVAAVLGIVASGVLTFYFPKPLLVVGFSLFGAVLASVGTLSIATEPVGEYLVYEPAQVAGVILAAALGVLFQSRLGEKAEDNE
ncbi:MAG: hypothetical protein ACYSU0_21955, partial [Planctomycetota bacterium]